jgi:hypothetical protein
MELRRVGEFGRLAGLELSAEDEVKKLLVGFVLMVLVLFGHRSILSRDGR